MLSHLKTNSLFKICLFYGCTVPQSICLPDEYVKFELPPASPTTVQIGVDIKDIPKVSDKDFSVTLNAYFIVKWKDPRIIVSDSRNKSLLGSSGIVQYNSRFLSVTTFLFSWERKGKETRYTIKICVGALVLMKQIFASF